MAAKPLAPPDAHKISVSATHHGHTRHDDYAWLRDSDWQKVMHAPEQLAPDIRAHLEAENAYTQAVLAPTQAMQTQLFTEMRQRIEENETHLPVNHKHHAWAVRYVANGDHPLLCCGARHTPLQAVDDMRVILDGNQEATGRDYFKFVDYAPCPQGRILAWSYDDKGSEYITIGLRDIATQQDLPDILVHTFAGFDWSACGQFLFYIALDAYHRPYRVMRHRIGTSQADDICVYQERDAGFYLNLFKTRSGRFLVICPHDNETAECHIIPADTPTATPICVAPRTRGIEYHIDDDAARDRLIIRANKDSADFQLYTAPVPQTHSDTTTWQAVRPHQAPHQAGQLILAAYPFRNHLAMLIRENALPRIEILDFAKPDAPTIINFAEDAYDLDFGTMAEYDTDILRFHYDSMTTPTQIFDYNMTTATRQLKKSRVIPSGHNVADYITRRLFARGHDGVQIPISLLYHKDTPIDGSAPVLLYGYGAYGITIPAGFSSNRLSLVQRGFIYAIAHIRGGRACGQNWFLQARGKTKTNSFKDFISVAEYLIEQGFTARKRITIHGGSAGGLLVGAVVNMAPDLFLGAVAEVPFVDTLNTMLDDTLPLTPPEWREWGNPITDKAAYQTILSYAPYENICPKSYPHILATGGLTDPRVTYWEPAKWIARLREKRTDKGLTLLHTYMQAGHGGKAGRFNQLYEIAFVYAFILMIHNVST